MAGRKDYILKTWPSNSTNADRGTNTTVHNAKKYTVIKQSPVPGWVKSVTVALGILGTLATVIYLYNCQQSPRLVIAAYIFGSEKTIDSQQIEPWKRGLFIIAILGLLNRALCYIFQSNIEESILVMRNIGIELTTKKPSMFFLLGKANRNITTELFIPVNDIVDIIIHEAFVGFEVIFYMLIIRSSARKLTIVFGELLPRRHQLELVLRGARKTLFYGRNDNKLKIPGIKDC